LGVKSFLIESGLPEFQPMDMDSLNEAVEIMSKTKIPSDISWNLKLNSRATLNYKVDFVIGKK
jgi:hypothetical protein